MRTGLTAMLLCMTLPGCGWPGSSAADAYDAYQVAAAAGNLPEARNALLALVAAEEDVADYWAELGRAQLRLGALPDAYYAFSRAHELDRSNVDVLVALTELALRSGNLELAKEHAQQLELLAPASRSVQLTYGYVALRRGQLDEAEVQAGKLLELDRFSADANILKARILIARDRIDEAKQLLRRQVEMRPDNLAGWIALTSIYERSDDWCELASIGPHVLKADEAEYAAALLAIEGAFRCGRHDAGLAMSSTLLDGSPSPDLLQSVLALWSAYWPGTERIDAALARVRSAAPDHQLEYADFLNGLGQPRLAARIVADAAQGSVSSGNASAYAIKARALDLLGRKSEAKQLYDQIIAHDPGHARALRGRAQLSIATGAAKDAIVDAQKLVTLFPDSADNRLLLARAYGAERNMRALERTMWDAFQEVPAERRIYAALRDHLIRTKRSSSVQQISEEFERQRDLKMMREFV